MFGLWVIDSVDSQIYQRQDEELPWSQMGDGAIKQAGHWFKINDPSSSNHAKHTCVYGIDHYVWAITEDQSLQYRTEMKYDNHAQHQGHDWQQVDNKKWISVFGNYDTTLGFAIDDENNIFMREGISLMEQGGTGWAPLGGKWKQARLGPGDVIWGIDMDDNVQTMGIDDRNSCPFA